jgi:hypothetical protein
MTERYEKKKCYLSDRLTPASSPDKESHPIK